MLAPNNLDLYARDSRLTAGLYRTKVDPCQLCRGWRIDGAANISKRQLVDMIGVLVCHQNRIGTDKSIRLAPDTGIDDYYHPVDLEPNTRMGVAN